MMVKIDEAMMENSPFFHQRTYTTISSYFSKCTYMIAKCQVYSCVSLQATVCYFEA